MITMMLVMAIVREIPPFLSKGVYSLQREISFGRKILLEKRVQLGIINKCRFI